MDDDARLERAERFIERLKSRDREAVQLAQRVAQWTHSQGRGRARLAPMRESSVNQLAGYAPPDEETIAIDTPTVVKRTTTQRLDSMIERLKTLPPDLLEAKIKEIQGEFFKLGMPVTYDDLKAVAGQYLNRADQGRIVVGNAPKPNRAMRRHPSR